MALRVPGLTAVLVAGVLDRGKTTVLAMKSTLGSKGVIMRGV